MRRITVSVAVALCALGAFAAPAIAKEKVVFGEFVAHVVGQDLETTPGVLKLTKEGEISLNKLVLGPYKFGRVYWENVYGPKGELLHHADEQNFEEPCERPVKVSGLVNKERSSGLTFVLTFSKCPAVVLPQGQGAYGQVGYANFKLGVTVKSNLSAEVGASENEIEIEPKDMKFSGALHKCPVFLEKQTIPAKDNLEKEYEEVIESIENESEEPEHWETSKKLKALYPSGEKEFIGVEFGEKFRHIVSYGPAVKPCWVNKGEENAHYVTTGPHAGQYEFTNGALEADIEYLEIKNGDIKFEEPPTP